jgi:hypothetical protein
MENQAVWEEEIPIFAKDPWRKDFIVTLEICFPSGRRNTICVPAGERKQAEIMVTAPGCAPVVVGMWLSADFKRREIVVFAYHKDAVIGRIFSRDSGREWSAGDSRRTVKGHCLVRFSSVNVVVVAELGGQPRRELAVLRLDDILLRSSQTWNSSASPIQQLSFDMVVGRVQIDHVHKGVIVASMDGAALMATALCKNVSFAGVELELGILRPGRFEATFNTDIAEEFFGFLTSAGLDPTCLSIGGTTAGVNGISRLGGIPFSLGVVVAPERPVSLRVGEAYLEPMTARVWCEVLIQSFPFLSSELKVICKFCTMSTRLTLDGVRMELGVGRVLEGFHGSLCEAGEEILRKIRRCVLTNLARIVHRSNLLNVFGGKLWKRGKSRQKTEMNFDRVVQGDGRILFPS